jgi:hypothetical protein
MSFQYCRFIIVINSLCHPVSFGMMGLGCGKLPTALVLRWGALRFCGEVLAFLGNFRLLLASSIRFQARFCGFTGLK